MAGSRVLRAVTWGWVFVWIFSIAVLPFMFYVPAATVFRHTYETSAPPGTLVSDRWNFEFWVVGLYVLLWLIPLSFAFMLGAPYSAGRRVFHLILITLLFIWYTVLLVIGAVQWANANKTDVDNYDNPANDDRWCCVYFNLPGAPCVNTAPCVPGVGAGDLTVDHVFLMQFWYNVVLMLAVVVDYVYVWFVLKRAVDIAMRESAEPLMDNYARGHAYRGRRK